MRRKTNRRFFRGVGVFFLVISILFILVAAFACNKEDSKGHKLPKMTIYLDNITLDEINRNDKGIRYDVDSIEYSNGDNHVSYENNIEISGRGNSTWGDNKKPYNLHFGSKVSFGKEDKTKKWMLITNNYDDTLMRNDLGLFLSRLLEMEYASSGEFVELSVNDYDKDEPEEQGVYYLTEAIKIGKDFVDISDPYGILVELDNSSCQYEEEWFMTTDDDCFTIKDAVNKDLKKDAMEKFLNKYEKLEESAKVGDYKSVSRIADLDSFAKYYLISDLSLNRDAYVTSFFLYTDGDDDKIHAGPVWDFDVAFGNTNLRKGELPESYYSPWEESMAKDYVFGAKYYDDELGEYIQIRPDTLTARLMYYLIEMPEFQELVLKVYHEKIYKKEESIIKYLNERKNSIREFALKDTELWGKNDFDDAIDYLEWWLEQRLELFRERYGDGNLLKLSEKEI